MSQQPAWCYYDNNQENGKIYGKLYNRYAVSDPRGLAPLGWHVPTDNEWTTLADYLGGQKVAGGKMKSVSGWAENGNGNNSSDFSARPCGNRGFDSSFKNLGLAVFFWSASAYSVNHGCIAFILTVAMCSDTAVENQSVHLFVALWIKLKNYLL